MVLKTVFRPAWVAALVVTVGLLSTRANAVERSADGSKSEPTVKEVELFAAMESGEIDVKLIPKNSKQSTVIIENKGDAPLRIKLPDAFAGVPVLAQMGMGMGGGGMGGMGGMMGGMFNVDAGKTRKLKLPTVCLEHGKPDPNPRMQYKLVPIESLTRKGEVIEICKMLGTNRLEQSAAQAAAWHFSDNLSWEELANKVGVTHIHGPSEPFFNADQLRIGLQIASEAVRRARENPAYNDPAYKDKVNSLSSSLSDNK